MTRAGRGGAAARGRDRCAATRTPELCAAANRGQWGHKTPETWPIAEFAGSTALGLRRGGLIVGICRIIPASGTSTRQAWSRAQRDQAGYRILLTAGLSRITAGQATLESWGDGPGRVRVCGPLGLTTAEYCPGWELDRADHARAPLPG